MWSNTQKQLAVRACNQARITDDQRRMILSGPAIGGRAMHHGKITSTSPDLTNADFEQFMAQVEHISGGQVLHFSQGYFRGKADSGVNERLVQLAHDLAAKQTRYQLPGLCRRLSRGRAGAIEDLTAKECWNLVECLKGIIARDGQGAGGKGQADREGEAPSEPSVIPGAIENRKSKIENRRQAEMHSALQSIADQEVPF